MSADKDDDKVIDMQKARKAREEPPPGETHADALARAIASVNERFGLVDDGGTMLVWAMHPDEDGRWSSYRESDFKLKLANEKVLVADKKSGDVVHKALAPLWYQSKQRREFNGVGMWPVGEEPPGKLNFWKGFAVEPLQGECPTIHEFLLHTVCCGNVTNYNYLLDLIAWKLQNPFAAPEVALALRGDTGVGKGTLARILARIFGSAFKTVSSSEHVLGKFNDMLVGATVMFLDEAFFAGDGRQVDAFKALVTEPRITIHAKYRPARQIPNSVFYVIATNHDLVISGMAGDRRHFVLEPSDAHMGDAAYWQGVHAAIAGAELQGFLEEMLAADLEGFHPRTSLPKTDALAEQKLLSLKGVEAFVHELLEDESLSRLTSPYGYTGPSEDGWREGTVDVEIGTAWENYKRWHVEMRQYGAPSRKAFEMKLRKLLPIESKQRSSTTQSARRFWRFASHPECGAAFANWLKTGKGRAK